VPWIQPQADAVSCVTASPGTPQTAGVVEAVFRESDGTPDVLSETEAHVPKPRHQTPALRRLRGSHQQASLPTWGTEVVALLSEMTLSYEAGVLS